MTPILMYSFNRIITHIYHHQHLQLVKSLSVDLWAPHLKMQRSVVSGLYIIFIFWGELAIIFLYL